MRRALPKLAALLAALSAVAASAYVLPSWSILRRMVNARDELNLFSLRVDGTVTFVGAGAREASAALGLLDRTEVQLDATVMMKLPGRCRFEVSSPEGGRAAVATTDGKLRVEGKDIPSLSVAIEQICAVLAVRSGSGGDGREVVVNYLKENRIETNTTSLARIAGQVAYVIGTPGEGRPQFWVYKDTFLPARLRVPDGKLLWDVRLIDFNSPVAGEWFPRTVEVYKGAELMLRFTGLRSDSKATLADKLF